MFVAAIRGTPLLLLASGWWLISLRGEGTVRDGPLARRGTAFLPLRAVLLLGVGVGVRRRAGGDTLGATRLTVAARSGVGARLRRRRRAGLHADDPVAKDAVGDLQRVVQPLEQLVLALELEERVVRL